MNAPSSVALVVPAHDEARRLPALIDALSAVMEPGWRLVIVDDGSADGTASVAREQIAVAGIDGEVIELGTNRGKGAALRAGVVATSAELVVTMDADLATDLDALPALMAALGTHDVAVGSRNAPGALVHDDSRIRRIGARVFNGIVRVSTGLHVTDTQCGFKAFRGPLARRVFAASRADRWGQDVEVLDLAARLGASLSEVPVAWTAVEGSHVRVGPDAVRTMVEIVAYLRRRRSVLSALASATSGH
jgi:dolichyl-phosphate beta-glucosyltransferase